MSTADNILNYFGFCLIVLIHNSSFMHHTWKPPTDFCFGHIGKMHWFDIFHVAIHDALESGRVNT